jgi:hypothetical protein
VNAVHKLPEEHMFETVPIFLNWPSFAVDAERGRSLQYRDDDDDDGGGAVTCRAAGLFQRPFWRARVGQSC